MKTAPLWKPMLAAKPDPDTLDDTLAGLAHPALYSAKLDGIRATVQNGRLYSRSLKLIPNLAMQALWGRAELNGLDGEIIVGEPTAEDCFNRSTRGVMSRNSTAAGAAYHVFDMFSIDHHYSRRLADAADLLDRIRPAGARLVPHKSIPSLAALRRYEETILKQGHEGVMRRAPDGCYKQGRSTLKEGGLIAIKRFVDAEALVLGVYEQEMNTNVQAVNELGQSRRSSAKAGKVGKNTLGGFSVQIVGDDAVPSFNIGSGVGLTDEVRRALWRHKAALPGRVVKFRYQKVGTKDAPRIPIFLGFRDSSDK